MAYPEHDILGRRLCAITAAAGALVGVLCLGWPALASQVLPWPMPPLHARCVGVMHLALALQLVAALRSLDPHSLRIPLAAVAAWCAASIIGLVLRPGPGGWAGISAAWGAGWTALAFAAIALLRRRHAGNEPAERPARGWQALAIVAAAIAAVLLAWPDYAISVWPWKLSAPLAVAYAAPFLAFGVAAWGTARERRLYVQRPVQQSLALLGSGVLLACVLHRALFDFQRPAAWVWFASFALLAVFALQALRPAIRHT